MDNVIDLGRLWLIVRRNWTFMLALGVIAGGVAFGVSKFLIHPQYSSSAALLVNRKQDNAQAGVQYADQQADVQIINTYKDIITRPIILNTVVNDLTKPHKEQIQAAVPAQYTTDEFGEKVQTVPAQPAKYKLVAAKYDNTDLNSDSVAKMISISNQTNSQVFSVNVKSGDATMSKDIANTIAEVFKDKVASIMSVSNVSIVSKATTNSTPVAPNVKLITLAGLILGVFAGFAWGFIKEVTDRTVKDLEFLTNDLKLTNLGVIGYIGKIRDFKDVIAANEKKHANNETRTSRLGQRI
ncbi:capsular biosynthesis protein [Weissella confusa]|uniref:Capsular polysaccharide biosynthesis protein CpsC n=1 Tax=Weissella fermenti TaxID=2987699 RepID=A0ABT6D326_9LACO|nr:MULTISPECIES: Wzz/FepE/Etk N-terminal domain-containing protein [Weissella]MBJ7687550.1 capsular biosynthesis protein [Weissella confusa]MDF9299908.1 Wzz/FepE/Etk N-terminal domain-containing protein [Weissella sp. BK2]